nr:hypothetical protein [Bacteroidales bacterium]
PFGKLKSDWENIWPKMINTSNFIQQNFTYFKKGQYKILCMNANQQKTPSKHFNAVLETIIQFIKKN